MVLGLGLIPLAMLIARGSRDLCSQGQVMWQASMLSVQDRLVVVQVVCMVKEGPFVIRYATLPPLESDSEPGEGGEGPGPAAAPPEELKPANPYEAPDADVDPDYGWYYWGERYQSSASAIEAARAGNWET
jgi:hypothetical protein